MVIREHDCWKGREVHRRLNGLGEPALTHVGRDTDHRNLALTGPQRLAHSTRDEALRACIEGKVAGFVGMKAPASIDSVSFG
jgi:hypothetical protein